MSQLNHHQKSIFLSGEGDRWYDRNKSAIQLKKNDPVIDILLRNNVKPVSTLEIGCANGYRLSRIRHELKSSCFGIDPSAEAIADGLTLDPLLNLVQGTADNIPFSGSFDLVIFGFCLYLCDRADLFRIVSEADRVLKDGGQLVVYDFEPSFPLKNTYKYAEGIQSYKMNYAGLFTSNPAYCELAKDVLTHYEGNMHIEDPNERVSVTLLMKNAAFAYADNPFAH